MSLALHPGPQAQFGQFADPFALVADSFTAFLPPPQKDVADWAAESRYLSNPGGGYTGRWVHDMAPYLVSPMQCLKGTTYLTTVFVGPAQSGKTTIAENWLGASVELDPADFLWYMQTDPAVQAFVKDRINPMVTDHAGMKSRLGLEAVDNSLHYKRFAGMRAEFLAAIYNNLIGKKAPRIVLDEIDAYVASLGDVLGLADFRRQTFGDESMVLAMSHCDKATGLDPNEDWNSGIMAAFKDSDRRLWYWPCPHSHCGLVSSPAPTAKWVTILDISRNGSLDEIAAKTRLYCPHCGGEIADHQRRAMNIAAFRSAYRGWIGLGQDISPEGEVEGALIETRTAGFWMQGVMSPFLLSGIGGLARAVVKAERELEDGTSETALQSLRDAVVKGLGLPFSAVKKHGSIDAQTLADRAEPDLQLRTVPEGARFLTAWVDIGGVYFDVMVRGWGPGGESWIVDQFKIVVSERLGPSGDPLPVDPANHAADWDQMLTRLTGARYPLADASSRGMAIRAIGYDAFGAPGVTAQAYAAWTRWRNPAEGRSYTIKNYGKVGERDIYSVMPTKGIPGVRVTRLSVVYPDSQRKDRMVKTRGEIPMVQFSPNAFKDEMAGHLGKAEPGEWYVHAPAELLTRDASGQPKPPHLFFEQLVSEAPDKAGNWDKIKPNARNEAIDQMVATHVLAHLHGLTRINWDKPPNWAAPHDKNSMVEPIELVSTNGTVAGIALTNPPSQAAKKSWLDRMAH